MRGNYFRSNSSWVILKSLGCVSLANHIKRLKTRKGAPRKNSRKNNVADDKPRYLFLVNRIQSWPIASDWGREFTHLRVSSTGLSETKLREKREIPLHEDGTHLHYWFSLWASYWWGNKYLIKYIFCDFRFIISSSESVHQNFYTYA